MRIGNGFGGRGGGPRRHGRGGHGHGPMRGHGSRRRLFDGGELRLVLLALIVDQPRHGYDLIREIETRTGGAYAPSPGVVYPTLTLLADMGLIVEDSADGARKRFTATEAGRAQFAADGPAVEALFARLSALATVTERTDGGPVRRAMGNLKAVLQDRLAADDVDQDMLLATAALIDEAAGKIERLK
ncbi:PadR family transcriptional regulator [Sphingomonas flavalba]|uniref:PadR family transcriptional regulator n=1 Tax=Sphingomonas flavalba TaxID=2559804 RepID=UPI0039E073F5